MSSTDNARGVFISASGRDGVFATQHYENSLPCFLHYFYTQATRHYAMHAKCATPEVVAHLPTLPAKPWAHGFNNPLPFLAD